MTTAATMPPSVPEEAGPALGSAFRGHWEDLDRPAPGEPAVVAVSGGVDSVTLLHLLRFLPAGDRPALHVAHFDHALRPSSAGDAHWVRGLARAWDLPVHVERAPFVAGGEGRARQLRYAFLQDVRRRTGADWILTAHHADDQAETVIFRILRGSGIRGLRGIEEHRRDGVLRPLLPFWRSQILEHAQRHRLRPRLDPTNLDLRFARNRIRHVILPGLEDAAGGGVRASLVRLSRRARENEDAWDDVMGWLLASLDVEAREREISVARPGLLSYDSGVRARVLRDLARRLGSRLDAAGTEAALDFAHRGASGRTLRLPGPLRLSRSFDRLTMSLASERTDTVPLELPGPGTGGGSLVIRGRPYTVRWSPRLSETEGWSAGFPAEGLCFPLCFREWRPGDRMRLDYGSKKLSRVFAEARVPVRERRQRPVLADGRGRILWVPGIMQASLDASSDRDLHIVVGNADADEP